MVKFENFDFGYRKKQVFNNLTVQFNRGYIYGLLGKNGSGKSTLLNNIAGLLFPKNGSVKVFNQKSGERNADLLQDIFLIPEEFFLPDTTIKQFLKYNSPFYPKFDKTLFDNCLDVFEIPHTNSLQALSYGQRKKVLISFGLATNVRLLLMDEPTNGLDIKGKSQVRKMIARAFSDEKCIIISSHQVRDLENLIDRVMVIDDGRILLDRSVHDITDKLSFKISFEPAELSWAIYSEPLLRGNAIVSINAEGEEDRLDLELFYKAVMANPAVMHSIFKN
ncbi:ABC transporter ATP-binding protein [Danxiaibacter flavus]|uniref:ABC transporter ATP-binding protein n=1 Tax=Danxiaibacter flavus TaxID=3049108 RepID=A0ABV3ZL57_9BACT|nr:ABC transporter ATP-binding protein [Chitinophagaceae bacterium DXS]